jgi:class 3 adenylate cyclase
VAVGEAAIDERAVHRDQQSDVRAPCSERPLQETTTKAATPVATALSTGAAKRRQLTVMFCDLVGSTALSARLDPEDMRRVIRAYQDDSSGVVARCDGFVAKFMGDGILAYFGFPRAHEDDPERAVRAGLASFCRIGRWDQRKNLI